MIEQTLDLYQLGYEYARQQTNSEMIFLSLTALFIGICFLVYYIENKKIKTFLSSKKQLQEYSDWKRQRKLEED